MISRPKGVWIIALLLLAYGSYTSWLAFSYGSVWFLLWTAACFVAAGSLLFSQSWSRYFVYLVAFSTAIGWAVFVATMALNGWPYAVRGTLFVIVHGAVLLAACALSIMYVHRHFRRGVQQT